MEQTSLVAVEYKVAQVEEEVDLPLAMPVALQMAQGLVGAQQVMSALLEVVGEVVVAMARELQAVMVAQAQSADQLKASLRVEEVVQEQPLVLAEPMVALPGMVAPAMAGLGKEVRW